MKVFFCGIILFLSFASINAQQKLAIDAKVNEQVELMSIVARLAGYDEYVNNQFRAYAEDVDLHFGKHKNHELIQFARKIRQSNGIGFERVMAMAVHLNPNLTPKVPFTETAPNKSWGKPTAEEFVRLLKVFYKEANCSEFFVSHAGMYRIAEQRYQKVVDEIDIPWFERFYGERPSGTFNVYIGLLNDGGNYNADVIFPKGRKDIFAIMGTSAADDKNLPVFSAEADLPVVIHEFNHSFVNHLVDENRKPFELSCSTIHNLVAAKMSKLAYGSWQTALNESLVRVGVIRYLFDHQSIENTNRKIIEEKANGFVWMDELFVLLGTYENSRLAFPKLRSFMPVLAGYHIDLAKRVEYKIKEFEAMKPKVVAIGEFRNESQEVSSDIKQITFVFDKPMIGKGSIDYGKSRETGFPEFQKIVGYSEDSRKFTIQVKLKPNWEYEFIVNGKGFTSKDGYPLQDYVVRFKTR